MRGLAEGTSRARHREIMLAVPLFALFRRSWTRALDQIARFSLHPVAQLRVDIVGELPLLALRLYELLVTALDDAVAFLPLDILVVVAQLQGGVRLLDLSPLV